MTTAPTTAVAVIEPEFSDREQYALAASGAGPEAFPAALFGPTVAEGVLDTDLLLTRTTDPPGLPAGVLLRLVVETYPPGARRPNRDLGGQLEYEVWRVPLRHP